MENNLELMLAPVVNTCATILRSNLPAGMLDNEQLVAVVQTEVMNLEHLCLFNEKIMQCHPKTIMFAFRNVIKQNLSFDKSLGLVYVTTRKMTVEGREGVLTLEVTPTVNGEISLYKQAGSLVDITTNVKKSANGAVEVVTVNIHKPNGLDTFSFTEKDWNEWRKYSHRQNARGKKANEVNNKTLNCSNENYYNFYPNETGNTSASPDNPGFINEGFCITKCIKHALKRSKMDKNPYAKRNLGFHHEKYVDETFDQEDEVFSDFENVPEEQPAPPKAQEKKATKKEEPAAPTPPIVDARVNDELYLEFDNAKTSDECIVLFNKHKPVMTKNQDLLAYARARKSTLENAERNTKSQEAPVPPPPPQPVPPPPPIEKPAEKVSFGSFDL